MNVFLPDDPRPWRFLANLFAAPLDEAGWIAARQELANLSDATDPSPANVALGEMRNAFDALARESGPVAKLQRAYSQLFTGAGGRATSPYESAFTEPNSRLFGEAEGRMRSLLTQLGLHVADGLHEPADHVAIELAAMAELLASDPSQPLRRELASQMNHWLGAFKESCHAHDPLGVYAAAAAAAFALAQQSAATDETFQEEAL